MSTLIYAGAVAAAIAAIVGVIAIPWMVFRRLGTLSEGIMGKPAVTDRSGATVEKAVPSLQARVGKIEDLLIGQREANNRLTELESWRVQHEQFSQDVVLRLLDLQSKTNDTKKAS